MHFGFSKAHHKITPRGKSGRGRGPGEHLKIWGSPLIFLQQLKVATSRLAGRWALPRHITKSHQKSGCGHGLGELPTLGFPFYISATTEASDFKFSMRLGLARAHHKTTPRGKVGVALG